MIASYYITLVTIIQQNLPIVYFCKNLGQQNNQFVTSQVHCTLSTFTLHIKTNIPYMVKGLTITLAGTNSSVALELGSKVTMAPSPVLNNNFPPVRKWTVNTAVTLVDQWHCLVTVNTVYMYSKIYSILQLGWFYSSQHNFYMPTAFIL